MVSLKGLPAFAMRDGLVVTPSRMARDSASRISSMSAVSIKNFIATHARRLELIRFVYYRIAQGPDALHGDFHGVSSYQGSNSGWSAGSDDVSGQQGHDVGNVTNYHVYWKDEIDGRSVLFYFTVDA